MSILFNINIPANPIVIDNAIVRPSPQCKLNPRRSESSLPPKFKAQKPDCAVPELLTPASLLNSIASPPSRVLEPVESITASSLAPISTVPIAALEVRPADQLLHWLGPCLAPSRLTQQSELFRQRTVTDCDRPPRNPIPSDQLIQWSSPPAAMQQHQPPPAVEDLTHLDNTTILAPQIEQLTADGLTGAVLSSSEILNQMAQYTTDGLAAAVLSSSPLLDSLARMPLVHQLSEVKPTDWAAQTLHSLAERHGCLAGHQRQRFPGNQPLSRHEFAVRIAACLGQVPPEAIADQLVLQQLADNFQTELAALHDQVDHLEAEITTLAANQFSTTTHLTGQAIFALIDADGEDIDVNPTFGSRLRLNFITSFTGRDRLRTTLGATNMARLDRATGFNETRLGFDGDTDGRWEVTNLNYRVPLSDSVGAIIGLKGLGMAGLSTPHNPFLSGNEGSLSRFGQRNPIYRVPHTGAGGGVKIHFTDNLGLDLGYSAGEAASNDPGSGFFNGDYGFLAQLNLQANPLHLGLTYIHSYTGAGRGVSTGTGSQAAQLNKIGPEAIKRPVVGNSFGVEVSYDLSDRIAVGGWVGYTNAQVLGIGRADVWNWAITLAFPDLGREGNLGGILVGMQPRLTGTSSGLKAIGQLPDPDVGLHIEAFYRYEVNHHLSITPGLILLTAPDHNTSNAPALIGTIRTVFRF